MSSTTTLDFSRFHTRLEQASPVMEYGIVEKVVANTIESHGPNVTLGSLCWLRQGPRRVAVEVVGLKNGKVISMPLAKTDGVRQGDVLEASGFAATIGMSERMQGRILDGLGRPIDGESLPLILDGQDLYA